MLWNHIVRKVAASATLAAVWTAFSMVALAIPAADNTGVITVTGQVTMNGHPAVSDSIVFSGSVIAAGDGASAVIAFGKAGKIEIGPQSTMGVSLRDGLISGQLTSGSISVLNSAQGVEVKTPSGETFVLEAGDVVSATGGKTSARRADHRDADGKCIDDDNDGKKECGISGGTLALILIAAGGATAAIIFAATRDNDSDLTVIASPTR
jgi:hypothetical protein